MATGIWGANKSNYLQKKTLDHENGVSAYTMPTPYISVVANAQYAVSAISVANPTHLTINGNLASDLMVRIAGSASTPTIDGLYQITHIDTTHISIPVAVTVAGTIGTITLTLSAGDPVMGFTATEVIGSGCARLLYGAGASSGIPAVGANAGTLSFGPAAGTSPGDDWGMCTGFVAWDALTTGHILWGADIITPHTIVVGQSLVVVPGALTDSEN